MEQQYNHMVVMQQRDSDRTCPMERNITKVSLIFVHLCSLIFYISSAGYSPCKSMMVV